MRCTHTDHKGRRCIRAEHLGLHTYGDGKRLKAARLAVKLRSKGRCEADIQGVCAIRAEHAHHRLRRSQGGRDEASNLIDVCMPCHRWIHEHPAAALDLGLLTSNPHKTEK